MEKRKYALARHFRRNLTDAEVLMWARLKGKPEGLHFRRQHPVGPYITDFYCAAARLGSSSKSMANFTWKTMSPYVTRVGRLILKIRD